MLVSVLGGEIDVDVTDTGTEVVLRVPTSSANRNLGLVAPEQIS